MLLRTLSEWCVAHARLDRYADLALPRKGSVIQPHLPVTWLALNTALVPIASPNPSDGSSVLLGRHRLRVHRLS